MIFSYSAIQEGLYYLPGGGLVVGLGGCVVGLGVARKKMKKEK